MKKIVLWGWSEPDMVRAIEILKLNSEIELIDWVADLSWVDRPFVNFLYNPTDLGRFKFDDYVGELTESELVKFLDMFSREKRSKGLGYHEQVNIAKAYFRFFLRELQLKQVDHVLFSILPIIGMDYLCYLAAKKLGVSVTMCYQSLFLDRFFYTHSLEDFGSFDDVVELEVDEIPEISWGFKKDLFYMEGEVTKNRQKNPWWTLFRETLRYGLRKSSKPVRYSGVIENFLQAKEFKQSYEKYAKSINDLDMQESFVYFPLHLQPELTTSGMGGGYSDQLDAIERLSDMLPHGWKIYVKENPKQGHEQRGAEFFRRLSMIHNVEYIAKEVDTYWLMGHSRFVATITGTAGWEAITGGKPCLVFGHAWYVSIPGVVKYTPTVTLSDILSQEIDQVIQKKVYEALYKKMRTGIVDADYIQMHPSYDFEENANKVAEFLSEIILDKPSFLGEKGKP